MSESKSSSPEASSTAVAVPLNFGQLRQLAEDSVRIRHDYGAAIAYLRRILQLPSFATGHTEACRRRTTILWGMILEDATRQTTAMFGRTVKPSKRHRIGGGLPYQGELVEALKRARYDRASVGSINYLMNLMRGDVAMNAGTMFMLGDCNRLLMPYLMHDGLPITDDVLQEVERCLGQGHL